MNRRELLVAAASAVAARSTLGRIVAALGDAPACIVIQGGGGRFVPGDCVRIIGTGEVCRVTAMSATLFTVMRAA